MIILGINAYHGNASAAILCDGRLVAAVEEERFSRIKYVAGFPARAVRYCLEAAGVSISEVDHIAIPRNPWARFASKVLYGLRLPRLAVERSRVVVRFAGLREELARACGVAPAAIRARWHRVEHHRAHLASAFFVSPFEQAAVLSADGLGDFASTMWATGRDNRLEVHGAVEFPHSLGLYYTAITQYLGFWKYGDEYKVMGLAAYGEPAYLDEFRRILASDDAVSVRGRRPGAAWREPGERRQEHRTAAQAALRAGPFALGLEYFVHHRSGPDMTWRESDRTPVLGRLFSDHMAARLGPARQVGEPLERRHQDVAATLQARLEEVYFDLLNALHAATGLRALCLAGGVAFNCVANGKIFDRTPFEKVYIQPAAGDAGLAVGAAFYVYHQVLGYPRAFVMDHAYWGPEFTPAAIRQTLDAAGLRYRQLPEEALCRETARYIADGKIVGWFQGRMEWGPRALGNRSIVVDPRRPEMKDVLNRRIKHREPFRPFAPSILEEATGEYFERSYPSPFMILAYPVRPEKRGVIPAPTHVDGTGRLQTVSRQANPRYWRLIKEFERLTGVPVVLNTSFNENEPIVCTPQEAVDCFLRTQMDVLAIGEFLVEGRNQILGK
jgi:carbamoyltransferase